MPVTFQKILSFLPKEIYSDFVNEFKLENREKEFLAQEINQENLKHIYNYLYSALKQVPHEEDVDEGLGDQIRDSLDPVWYALSDSSRLELK